MFVCVKGRFAAGVGWSCLLLSVVMAAGGASAQTVLPPAAPPLPPPAGPVVSVSSVAALQSAVDALTSGTTILIQPGLYPLTRTLRIRNGVSDVSLRGATGNRDDVRILGSGMNSPGVDIAVKVEFARDVQIANLSIGQTYHHPIQLQGEQGADRVHIYNVRLFDAGEQLLKSTQDPQNPDGVDDVIVEYSLIEYTSMGPSHGYTQGIDVHNGANWIIRDNVIRNIRVPATATFRQQPAILMWRGSRDTQVYRNTIINCERGIIFGLGPEAPFPNSHWGGAIYNNFIYRTDTVNADAGISIWDSPNTWVAHNTVIQNGTYQDAIEYRFASTVGVVVANNLTDGAITQRDGAQATLVGNYTQATSGMFVNAAGADLHLASTATQAIDRGAVFPQVPFDWDGQTRPAGAGWDVGADEAAAEITNRPPAVSLTGPISGATFTAPAVVAVSATASDSDGTISRVDFYANGAWVGGDSTAPFESTLSDLAAGDYTLTASATDDGGASTISAAVTIRVSAASGTRASATFVALDADTRGSWIGVYGRDGMALAADAANYPAYAQVAVSGAAQWTWASSTSDVRALQRAAGTGRLAATWYAHSFAFDVNLTDGQTHQVAFYSVDWENAGRAQRVDVFDAASGTLLDSRTLTAFAGGQYVVWTLRGHVRLQLTRTGGVNAVVGGLFFDTPGGGGGGSSPASAAFLRSDASTRGNWIGVYGHDGYAIAADATALPSYARLAFNGALQWTWEAPAFDARALQRAGSGERVAATWYEAAFDIELNVTDGQSHQVALYLVDWENAGRSQQIDVLDAGSGALLDTRTISHYGGGVYLVWRVSGRVVLRTTNRGWPNAVVSAVFFE